MRSKNWPWWLVVVLLACAGITVLVLAHGERSPHEFWSIAVPGVLTGVGTLTLALVTVWMSRSERVRDDDLRAQQRTELQAQRVQGEMDEAIRDARRVVAQVAIVEQSIEIFKGTALPDFSTSIQVTNGGGSPISYVRVIEGRALAPGGRYEFRLEQEPQAEAWLVPIMLPGGQATVDGGRWCDVAGGGEVDTEDLKTIQASMRALVEWTDSRGTRWRRQGYKEPERIGSEV